MIPALAEPRERTMPDRKKRAKADTAGLSDDDLDKVQGGTVRETSPAPRPTGQETEPDGPVVIRSRSGVIIEFEDDV